MRFQEFWLYFSKGDILVNLCKHQQKRRYLKRPIANLDFYNKLWSFSLKISFLLSIYSYIQYSRAPMMRSQKKQETPLKFDTSSANLNCFILGKSKPKCGDNDSSARRNRTKKKSRGEKEKKIEFQEKVFLESVVSKILNDADCEGITDLIQDMVFPVAASGEPETVKNTPLEEIEQMQMNEIFSDNRSSQKIFSPQRNNIYGPPQSMYHLYPNQYTYGYPAGYQSFDKQECTTTIHSTIGNSFTDSPRGKELNPQMDMMNVMNQAMALSYSYNYYPTGNCGYQKSSNRKRKAVTGDEVQQYRILPNNIEADGRTTLMIRHIPNKYSEDMLLQQIYKNHKMKINFLYLPIDQFNSCNVGYAFVNFIHTKFILDFYKEFSGRKWDRFNSEKICELAYARIQGTTSLMDHFQHSLTGQLRGRTLVRPEEKKTREPNEGLSVGVDMQS